jgi:putative protein-disulfide isomerase
MTLSCDIETGLCTPSNLETSEEKIAQPQNTDIELIYIGDPMCSWCWGISNTVKDLQKYSTLNGVKFSIIVGGLRPGGGDTWNNQFKKFLRKEWQHIQNATGQPFSFKLLDQKLFNYDTEPACRAVVTVRELLSSQDINDQKLLEFYSAIQYKFYVEGEDPTNLDFYRDLCEIHNIDSKVFTEKFTSDDIEQKTFNEFKLNRNWGVNGFPSFALRIGNEIKVMDSGHIEFEKIINDINTAMTKKTESK